MAHRVSRKHEIIHRLFADNNGSVHRTPQRVIRSTVIQNDQQCSAISPRRELVEHNRNSHQDRIKTCGTNRIGRLPATTRNGATNMPRSQSNAESGRNASREGKYSIPAAARLARDKPD